MHNLLAMCLVKLKSQLIKVEIMSHDQILSLATKPLLFLVATKYTGIPERT